MLHLSRPLGEILNKAVELSRKELDPVMYTFRVTEPELHNDYCAVRVIKDISMRNLKTLKAAGATVTAGSFS